MSIDRALLEQPVSIRVIAILATLTVMVVWSVPRVPRPYVDYSATPFLSGISQPVEYGTDTLADTYAAKVVRHDIRDMYTRRLEQTPLEAATWTKEASSPYPPAMLLSLAALHAIGEWTGLELYGMVLLLAATFIGGSAIYFLRTRWYLFPLLYLNFMYFSERFVSVQDGSYLVMLNVVLAALFLARSRRSVADVLLAIATTMKLLPLYHLTRLREMTPGVRIAVMSVLTAGFLLPWFVWDNYLSIYAFNAGNKGDLGSAVGGLALALPVTLLIWRVERRGLFDIEERFAWTLVPFALFLAIKANAARHLLIALIVPDKRGIRTVAAALGLALHALAPSVIRLGSVTYISTAVLIVWLVYLLRRGEPAPISASFHRPRN